jgi:hypothetical protein
MFIDPGTKDYSTKRRLRATAARSTNKPRLLLERKREPAPLRLAIISTLLH